MSYTGSNPETVVSGFTQQALALKIDMGYMTFSWGGLMLFAMEQWADRSPVVWRKLWVTRSSALGQARQLCADASRYLDTVSTRWRPVEDLDFDDFIEHLRLHIEGGMN